MHTVILRKFTINISCHQHATSNITTNALAI